METALLDQLDQAKLDFTPEGARSAGKLLAALASEPLHTAESLVRYHEALLFMRAYPHNARILRAADRELTRFHARVERGDEGVELAALALRVAYHATRVVDVGRCHHAASERPETDRPSVLQSKTPVVCVVGVWLGAVVPDDFVLIVDRRDDAIFATKCSLVENLVVAVREHSGARRHVIALRQQVPDDFTSGIDTKRGAERTAQGRPESSEVE